MDANTNGCSTPGTTDNLLTLLVQCWQNYLVPCSYSSDMLFLTNYLNTVRSEMIFLHLYLLLLFEIRTKCVLRCRVCGEAVCTNPKQSAVEKERALQGRVCTHGVGFNATLRPIEEDMMKFFGLRPDYFHLIFCCMKPRVWSLQPCSREVVLGR